MKNRKEKILKRLINMKERKKERKKEWWCFKNINHKNRKNIKKEKKKIE